MRLDSTVVALTPCLEYTEQCLADAVEQVMTVVDQLPNLHSCSVLLKPNLITARYGALPCTEPAFILAAARWFTDQGARVAIGDSPAFGTAASALGMLGITAELAALGVRITNFSRARKVTLAGAGTAAIAVEAMDCDLLVNLPRVKAHAQTRVTLAVKNCFGCLVGLHKPWWHMAYGGRGGSFSNRLVQILDVLADAITLVDGVCAMHETGPIRGASYPLQLVGGSANSVAMDRALLQVLGIDCSDSPLMQASIAAGHVGTDLADLIFPLATPSQFSADGFQIPAELNPIRFNPFTFMQSTVKRIVLSRETSG